MKDRETQLAFIKARAEGKSFRAIMEELGISKATCSSWENTFKREIDKLREEQLEELYTAYSMTREARIKALGKVIERLDKAIEEKTLDGLTMDRLLDLRLRYGRELKAEYRKPAEPVTDNTLDGLLEQYNRLYTESRAGELSPADIKAQLSILDAKREIIFNIAGEMEREENEEPLNLNFGYTSKVIRHGEEA